MEQARKFVNIKELTPEILHTFISKIVVHERLKRYSKTAEQKADSRFKKLSAKYIELIINVLMDGEIKTNPFF